MAYDEDLAHRLRELLGPDEVVTERRMFGGLAFLVEGHMAITATREGIMVRVDPAEADTLVAREHVAAMHMNGRTMQNWLTVAPEGVRTKRQLEPWVRRAVAFVRTLPPK